MGIVIRNNKFINCGSAIKLEGLFKDARVDGNEFLNNYRDMEFIIHEDSNIVVEENFSQGCKADSLTVKEYSDKIESVKSFTEDIKNFSEEDRKKIKELLDEMKNSKDEPSKIKKVLKEIYDVGKSASTGLLLAYIKTELGW